MARPSPSTRLVFVHVIVVGAGIIGLAVAETLAARGATVTVIDMRGPGRGASQASAGMLAPYIEAHDATPLMSLCTRSFELFPDFVARIESASGRSVEYASSGTLQVALDGEEHGRLEALGTELVAAGVEARWLTASMLKELEPGLSTRAVGGLFVPVHATVRVASLMAALVEGARLSGVVFESPVTAAAVDSGPDGVRVKAGERELAADWAVIATGSWSKRVRVANVRALPMRPKRGQILHLDWIGDALPSHVLWGPGCYVVPWSDRSIFVGATMEDAGFDEHATAAGIQALTSSVIELLPGAAVATLRAVRVGLRPALPDGLPAIGPITRAPRVVVASGHYRNGILLAPLTAELVARHVIDGSVDDAFAVTSPDRFLD